MSTATLLRVLELVTEAECALQEGRRKPSDIGIARACVTAAKAYVEASIEVDADRAGQ